MAGRFSNPFPQFFDSTPNVYAGGTLEFYASGTSTPQNIYTNEDLSTPASNPLTLNAAGRAATDIFLQDLDYKVVLKDVDGNEIWTADPVSARDSSFIVKTLTGSGSPNGVVAGTAGSTTVLPDFYWDYTNHVLYVCTTTGDETTTVWTAINASSATAAVPPPQGRLTLASATPVIVSDQTAKTAVMYTPFVGNLVPIYNGTSMVPTEFAELTLTLTASHTAGSIYDVFVFSNSGVLTLVTGPAWTTVTAGSGARGSGASTTELTRVKGLWVNAVSMSAARNGSTTYAVPANQGTYLGSIYIDGSAGQVSCHVSYGQSRKFGVWNAYNRVPVILQAGDATASWGYNTGTIRASNGSSANSLTVFSGLPEDICESSFTQSVQGGIASVQSQVIATWSIGIGQNSTTAFSGQKATESVRIDGSSVDILVTRTSEARHILQPTIGLNVLTSLEVTTTNTNANLNYTGTSASMLLLSRWRG